MLTPGRYVPLQIQEKAIRYGTRTPDPLKSLGFSGTKRVCISLWKTGKIKALIFISLIVLRFWSEKLTGLSCIFSTCRKEGS